MNELALMQDHVNWPALRPGIAFNQPINAVLARTTPRTPNGVATALLSGITISCTQLNTRFADLMHRLETARASCASG
jgi:hypothetical protein